MINWFQILLVIVIFEAFIEYGWKYWYAHIIEYEKAA
jgi:hypothetical protein